MTETIIPLAAVLQWADEQGLVCGLAPDSIERLAAQRVCPQCAETMWAEGYYEAHVCVAWVLLCPRCWIAIDNVNIEGGSQ